MHANLLPNGLIDLLPDVAEREAEAIHNLMMFFKEKKYRRVKPPLIEFEETLLRGPGQSTAPHMFRMMDPKSQKMMGLRADITPQIARIAATRFSCKDYPLRFSYAGDVLHVKGTQLDPTRQFTQVGCELIGMDSIGADIECIMTALEGLDLIGAKDITLDITLPALLSGVFSSESQVTLFKALENKNKEQISELGGKYKDFLLALLSMSGNTDKDMAMLKSMKLPQNAQLELDRLHAVVSGVKAELEKNKNNRISITIDPTQHSFFDYHRGVSFTLYLKGVRDLVGRGGRYDFETDGGRHSAIGFSIYMNSLRHFLKKGN